MNRPEAVVQLHSVKSPVLTKLPLGRIEANGQQCSPLAADRRPRGQSLKLPLASLEQPHACLRRKLVENVLFFLVPFPTRRCVIEMEQ